MGLHQHETRLAWWRSRLNWTLIGFLAIAGFFLFTEHRAHVLGVLPLVLVALCPLLHLFGLRGHGGHGAHRPPDNGRKEP